MLLASSALAVVVGGAFAALLLAVAAQRDATDREQRSKDVTVATQQLEKLVLDIENGLRGLTLTGSPRFLQPYHAALRDLDAAIATVQRRVANDPGQRRRAQALSTRIEEYVFDYADPLVRIVRETPAAVQTTTVTNQGRIRTSEIRRLFNEFLGAEDDFAAAAAANAASRARTAVLVGVAGLAASSVLIVLFGLMLARSVARPVRAVALGASRLAGGDLAARLPPGGPGEVGELTLAFNAMAERLERGRAELEEQNEKLRESEQLKSELISIVSHELRTPLASVLGFTSLLLKRDFDTPTRRHYLGIVDAQSRRLAAILEDFLDLRRIEREGLAVAAERLDLALLIEEQAQLYTAQSPKHRVRVELGSRPIPVSGDPNRLAQVVGNLLSNAIKYSPDGGDVELAAERAGDGVRLSVRDHGLGIPRDQQGRIFTKFFRGDAGATGITGTGLGLAVSREIVEAHGGRIGFDSRPGEGSTFWVELPADETTDDGKETL